MATARVNAVDTRRGCTVDAEEVQLVMGLLAGEVMFVGGHRSGKASIDEHSERLGAIRAKWWGRSATRRRNRCSGPGVVNAGRAALALILAAREGGGGPREHDSPITCVWRIVQKLVCNRCLEASCL